MTVRAKGLVERANGYPETSFSPGRHFAGPDDFSIQLGEGLRDVLEAMGTWAMAVPDPDVDVTA